MSQITRCPACGTSFRVVPDQLRISQGWVRCGQCAEVFDAAQALQDAGAPMPSPAPVAPGPVEARPPPDDDHGFADTRASFADTTIDPTHAPQADGADAGRWRHAAAPGDASTPTLVDMAPAWLQTASSEMPVTDSVASLDAEFADFQQTQVQPDSAPAPLAPAAPDSEASHHARPDLQPHADAPASAAASTGPGPLDDTLPPAALGPGRLHVAPAEPGLKPRPTATAPQGGMPLLRRQAAEPPEPVPPPSMVTARPPAPPPPKPIDPAVAELSFMREAVIAAAPPPPPRARRLRWGGAVAAVLLALVLLLQWLVHERDRLAAAAPALRPVVQALCVPLGCRVQAPRRIDAVVIDGSSFVALGDDGYRLGFNLRNRASHAVALPALVVSLTDVQEQPVVRRVLLPAELGTPPAELPAHGEWSTSVDLRMADNAGRARVVGYRLDAFYP